jgi:hypothetical protein
MKFFQYTIYQIHSFISRFRGSYPNAGTLSISFSWILFNLTTILSLIEIITGRHTTSWITWATAPQHLQQEIWCLACFYFPYTAVLRFGGVLKAALSPESILDYERRGYQPWHVVTYIVVTLLLWYTSMCMDVNFRRTGNIFEWALPVPAVGSQPLQRSPLPLP